MLPKAHLTSHSRMSGSRGAITPLWLSGSWRSSLYSFSVYACRLFLISSASFRSLPFLYWAHLCMKYSCYHREISKTENGAYLSEVLSQTFWVTDEIQRAVHSPMSVTSPTNHSHVRLSAFCFVLTSQPGLYWNQPRKKPRERNFIEVRLWSDVLTHSYYANCKSCFWILPRVPHPIFCPKLGRLSWED